MSRKSFVFLGLCMAAVIAVIVLQFYKIFPFKDHTGNNEPGMVFVALQPIPGLLIDGENPIVLQPGSDASFKVSTDSGYYIAESDKYTYVDGVLNFGPIQNSCTLYVTLGNYYTLNVNVEGQGQAEASSITNLIMGETITVNFIPDEGYRLKSIKVNDIYRTLDSDSPFQLTIDGNTVLDVVFEEIPAPPRTTFNVIIKGEEEDIILPEYSELAPGTVVTLPLGDAEEITSGDYNIIGYNTKEDYSGSYYAFGSMVALGNEDLVLYPQKYMYSEASDFSGRIVNSIYLIEKYTGTPQNGLVCIPTYIGGIPVTEISKDAFSGVEGLTTVIFPVGMKKIPDGTINNCPDFTTIIVPQTLTEMTEKAVSKCSNFKNFRVIATLENKYTNTFDSALADKYVRLQNTEGKRIILLSGSSGSFGLSSQMLVDAFPEYNVINFSSSYLSGLHPLLQILSHYIHEGDIIILAPEYYASTYAASDPVNNNIWHAIEGNMNILNDLDASSYSAFISSYTDAMSALRSYISNNKFAYSSKYMKRSCFNEYGDLASVRPATNKKIISKISSSVVSNRGMNIINSYVDEFTAKGATCLFSFPPVYVNTLTNDFTTSMNAHYKKLSSELSSNCTIISNPADYVFTDNVFFDSPYHPTLEGATRRTKTLIEDLKNYFKTTK